MGIKAIELFNCFIVYRIIEVQFCYGHTKILSSHALLQEKVRLESLSSQTCIVNRTTLSLARFDFTRSKEYSTY